MPIQDEPYRMLDTTEGVESPKFHALPSYFDALAQKPALCGYQMIEASDFVRPRNDDPQLCSTCVEKMRAFGK
jgi:hypothetical protein